MGDDDGDNVITATFVDNMMGDDIVTGEDGMIIDQGGPGNPRPAGVLAFTSRYIGTAAALGAGVLAYLLRRRPVAI